MTEHSDIPGAIAVDKRRREAVEAAARRASVEVAEHNGSGKPFCDITYIVGAMREASDRFDSARQN